MENLNLVYYGKKLPEQYHFGFNGTHFQIFLSENAYHGLVRLMEKAHHFGKDFSLFAIKSGNFGFAGSACLSRTLSKDFCIAIPAVFDSEDYASLRSSAETLCVILLGLGTLLHQSAEQGELVEGSQSQLFELDTMVGEKGAMHAGGLGLSVSHVARRYLENLGENIRFPEALRVMKHHADAVWSSDNGEPVSLLDYFSVRSRTRGVIGMHTIGDCACLGTAPKDFEETEGYYLSSHNVDGLFQQFNLLVGVAYIWQMVRNGVHGEIQL